MNTCEKCGIDTELIVCLQCEKTFYEGVKYALKYLQEVFGDAISDTDIWYDYIGEGAN